MTQTMTDIRTRSGKSVESPFTGAEALAELSKLVEAGKVSSFGADLVRKAARHGLSPEQAKWVHVLVVEANNGGPKPTLLDEFDSGASIVRLFDTGAENLKRPKLKIRMDNGAGLRFARTTSRSKIGEGAVGVLHISSRGYETFVGWVLRDGTFALSGAIRGHLRNHNMAWGANEILDTVREFAADPIGVAAQRGVLSGSCSFCGLPLTDDRSIEAGWGPICAKRYGLPWGKKD